MAILTTDLVAYASQNMPEDDTSTNGGAIDALRRIIFTDIASTDTLEVVSSNAADAMDITVTARRSSGITASETKALTGTTPITLSSLGTVERVLKAELASAALGVVTVRRTTGAIQIAQIPPGERGFVRLFINAFSDLSSAKDYYMKFFWKNTHGTLSLINAIAKQSADPTGLITHLLASAVNDTTTTANRLTAPSAANTLDPDTFDDNDKSVPGSNLAAGDAIGVWLRLALSASQAPVKSTYTTQLFGLST